MMLHRGSSIGPGAQDALSRGIISVRESLGRSMGYVLEWRGGPKIQTSPSPKRKNRGGFVLRLAPKSARVTGCDFSGAALRRQSTECGERKRRAPQCLWQGGRGAGFSVFG